jgi:hypothetical protein
MSRGYSSNWETIGNSQDPDIVYYNATIVNNNTDDLTQTGFAITDPLVKFNETRTQPIIKDASQYQFSIIRFVVNGGNLDLPLFIPSIQSYTGQTDRNLTEYGFGITLNLSTQNSNGTPAIFRLCPPLTYLIFVPENVNNTIAPLPLPPSAPDYVGVWSALSAYNTNNIVSADNTLTLYFQAQQPVPSGTLFDAKNTDVNSPFFGKPYWLPASPELGRPQDVSSRYYWVNTFQHMVNMVNTTLVNANSALYDAFSAAWVANGNGNTAGNNPYATFDDWVIAFGTPVMNYDVSSGLFNITYPDVYLNGAPRSFLGVWMNVNSQALFANFPAVFYNTPSGDGSLGAILVGQTGPFQPGYAYRLDVQISDLGRNTIKTGEIFPTPTYSGAFWVRMTQEYISTSTIWSPIDALVFISNLLPLQNEQTAPPNTYGTGNIGNSSAAVQSAFQPIITDVANDLSSDPTAYRKMIYYAPVAEYRMADFQNSKTEIKNIDISVFWRNRLNNQLYPLAMYNLSSVSIKIMFRKKADLNKALRMAQ